MKLTKEKYEIEERKLQRAMDQALADGNMRKQEELSKELIALDDAYFGSEN